MTDDTITQYCERMKQGKVWGDGNVLTAAAYLYQHPVCVYTLDCKQPVIIKHPELHSDTRPITLGYVPELPDKEPNHYISLLERMDEESNLQTGVNV
jgi:hypothetical protein